MDEGTTVADHLNVFNMVIAQLTSIGVFVSEEEHSMLLLCSLPDSWDHPVMAIRSTTTQLKMDEVSVALLSKEMQRKSYEVAKEALIAQGRAKANSKKDTKPESSGKKSKAKCWNCG